MKLIEEISEMIDAEIDDAKKYIKCALYNKEERPMLAKTFYDLSVDEIRHMGLLHDEVTALINQYRNENGEPPADMLAVYNFLHQKNIDRASEVKVMQTQYKA